MRSSEAPDRPQRGKSWPDLSRIAPPWRTVGELGLALLCTGVLIGTLALPDSDPFWPCLVLLPVWIAALRAIARMAPVKADPRGASTNGNELRAGLLLGLVLLVMARSSLGLVAADWFLAGGLLLLLAASCRRQLLALGDSLQPEVPRRPHAAFFLLPWILYLALLPWTQNHRQPDGDEPYYLLLTHSLAYDFDVDLSNNYAQEDWQHFLDRPLQPQPGDPVGRDGQLYSRHNPAFPMFLAPAYRLAGVTGIRVLIAALAAALAWMALRLAHHEFPKHPRGALLAYALIAFGPPLVVYSQQVWIEVPAALLVAVALDRLRVMQQARAGGESWSMGRRKRDLCLFALALILMPLLKLRLGLVALSFLALAVMRLAPSRRALGTTGLFTALLLGSLALVNQLRYGNPLKIHQWSELQLIDQPPTRYLAGLFGMLWDSAFGLFAAAPLWLLVLPSAWLVWKSRRQLLVDVAVLSVPYLLVLAPRLEWYGGWSPPFRYPLLLLPLLCLVLVPALGNKDRPLLRAAAAALAVLTLVLALVWTLIPGWTYHFADGRTHLLDRASLRLGADVGRLFPSMVRPRTATWVWPLACLVVTPLLLWRPSRPWRSPERWGVVALLLLLAAVPLAATRWPTRIIEVEDAQVHKLKGRVFPFQWTRERAGKPGGWALTPGACMRAPVVAGGDQVDLRLRLRSAGEPVQQAAWQLKAGGRLLAEGGPAREGGEGTRGWSTVEVATQDWLRGEDLVMCSITEITPGGPRSHRWLLDRVELDWH